MGDGGWSAGAKLQAVFINFLGEGLPRMLSVYCCLDAAKGMHCELVM